MSDFVCIRVKSNSVYVRPADVSVIQGNGLGGSKGATIHLRGGQSIPTEYPVTQLVSILSEHLQSKGK
jgi:hypothetical protein